MVQQVVGATLGVACVNSRAPTMPHPWEWWSYVQN